MEKLIGNQLLWLLLPLAMAFTLPSSAQDHHEHELGNFISMHAGAKIYASSGYDSLSGLAANNVIDESQKLTGVWRSGSKALTHHWIIIELPEVEEISTLMFNTAHLKTEDACPRHIEIEFSTKGPTIDYQRIARETLRPNIEEQIISIETNETRWIRINIYNTWGNTPFVELGRVYAYNDVEINMIEMVLMNEGKLDLQSIRFDSNSDHLQPGSYPKLEMIAQVLRNHPEWNVKVEGHTDSDGSYRYNMVLSQKRADAVKRVLIDSGLEADRVSAKGYGFTKKIAEEASEEGKAKNRRVTIIVENKDKE